MAKITDGWITFAVKTYTDTIFTCCIQWFPGDPLPECDDAEIYEDISAAVHNGDGNDLFPRLNSVAEKHGGTFQLLDVWRYFE